MEGELSGSPPIKDEDMNPKTARILAINGVDKISFYFINSAIVNNAFTTCVLINSSKQRIEARGVAICSMLDTFSKAKGKNKALGRAVKALVKKRNSWKINGSGRDEEFILRSYKVKSEADDVQFRNDIASELQRIDPELPIRVLPSGRHKKYSFEVPASYPVRLANTLFRYKSQYRPVPVGDEEQDLIKKLTIFTEPIVRIEIEHSEGC